MTGKVGLIYTIQRYDKDVVPYLVSRKNHQRILVKKKVNIIKGII